MPQLLQIAAIAAATFGTGAATLTVMNEDIPDLAVPEGDWPMPVDACFHSICDWTCHWTDLRLG